MQTSGVRLSRIIAGGYFVLPLALVFLLLASESGGLRLLQPDALVALVLASVAGGMALLLLKGWTRSAALILSIFYLPEFIVRGFVLMARPSRFSFDPYTTIDLRFHALTTLVGAAGMGFVLLGFAVGNARLRRGKGEDQVQTGFAGASRAGPLVAAVVAGVVVNGVLVLGFREGITGHSTGSFGWMLRLAPLGVAAIAGILALRRYGPGLGKTQRVALVASLVAVVVITLLAGSRGAFVPVLLAYLFVRIGLEQDPRISPRILAALVLVVLLMPVAVDVGQAVRQSWFIEGELDPAAVAASYTAERAAASGSAFETVARMSGFFTGFDHLSVVIAQPEPEHLKIFSVRGYILTIAGSLVPGYDALEQGDSVPLTRYHAYAYRGLGLDVQHSEGWGLVTQAWLLLGWGWPFFLMICGFLWAGALHVFAWRAQSRSTDSHGSGAGLRGSGFAAAWIMSVGLYVGRAGWMEGIVVDTLIIVIVVTAAWAVWTALASILRVFRSRTARGPGA